MKARRGLRTVTAHQVYRAAVPGDTVSVCIHLSSSIHNGPSKTRGAADGVEGGAREFSVLYNDSISLYLL